MRPDEMNKFADSMVEVSKKMPKPDQDRVATIVMAWKITAEVCDRLDNLIDVLERLEVEFIKRMNP